MSVHDFYITFKEHGTLFLAGVIVLMTLIQVVPIKINPWSWLLKKLNKLFTGELSEQIKQVDKKIDAVSNKLNNHIEESNAKDLRERRESILDFASAIAEGKRQYTKEQYEQMLVECDNYTMFCDEKKFRNAVAEESISLIRHSYMDKMLHNSFLKAPTFNLSQNDEDT